MTPKLWCFLLENISSFNQFVNSFLLWKIVHKQPNHSLLYILHVSWLLSNWMIKIILESNIYCSISIKYEFWGSTCMFLAVKSQTALLFLRTEIAHGMCPETGCKAYNGRRYYWINFKLMSMHFLNIKLIYLSILTRENISWGWVDIMIKTLFYFYFA